MNRPFSRLKNILSVFIYNKYCTQRFAKLDNFDEAHAFVLMSNFNCERKTVPTNDSIEEINHFTWHTGTVDNAEEISLLKTLTGGWYNRHGKLFYKMEIEYPFFHCVSIDEYL